jgi:hypothetical protein
VAMEPAPTPDPEPRFSDQVDALLDTRLARRIVAVTMGGALVLGAVAWWLFVVPYDSGGPSAITCGATSTWWRAPPARPCSNATSKAARMPGRAVATPRW